MSVKGIRGAITVEHNLEKEIYEATAELFCEMVDKNGIEPEDVCSLWITATPDLNAVFPAAAIRSISGWEYIPMLCASEMAVPHAISGCIRMLLLVETEKTSKEIKHIFLRDAMRLRPDLNENST
ncbi:chorismate mutase [Hazenella coriacea]|uniref:chorismate mutase n=1 Tax=Hazenella coriacea TaxID=1179467 RepID=UPI00104BB263|nr:chorismate mutase [Hazenella coriacea]